MEQKPWQEELSKFLCNYRATPHCSTGQAPTTVLLNHQMHTKIATLRTDLQEQVDIWEREREREREREIEAKRKMKTYSDNKAYIKPSLVCTGDTVIVQRDKTYCKSQTPFPGRGGGGRLPYLTRRGWSSQHLRDEIVVLVTLRLVFLIKNILLCWPSAQNKKKILEKHWFMEKWCHYDIIMHVILMCILLQLIRY